MSETQLIDANQMAAAAKESCEILAGYRLEHRIGSGGFGEVWKASAPGGLEKAVKILYGKFDDQQAEAELKSLERVRSLHHPFLLNIERIEISVGRLVIVTELAESSLEDRFAECRKQNLDGIPYEELMGYLRDAADALDYMSDRHGLQHLDVKPDNLLLQGGHVKVADFGLTKDLSQSQVSLVGAFTPLYAPPELYEGQPAATSDQYSLAIVYQSMLTGIPPFVGRTAAQLAAQHLNSQPNLQSLPMPDRPPIARALSKNPEARFGTCREFLDEIDRRHGGGEKAKARVVSPGIEKRPALKKQVEPIPAGSTELVNYSHESRPLDDFSVDAGQTTKFRPVLVIGIGGLAGRVLNDLKQRIQMRYGPDVDLPGLGFLYVDSDPQAVSLATRRRSGALTYRETLAIPLRSPQAYKSDEVDFSEWLSRRWLFNIPRSKQVEGMRALGRLAFADHHAAIRQRLREGFTRLISKETQAAMQELTGLPFEAGAPSVFVLSSIMGGTGSGAALDLGYLVQDELSGMALEKGEVQGLLMFGTDDRDHDRDLAIANGICLMEELSHFHSEKYPGDSTCDLPQIPAAPFQDTYLIHLGEHLGGSASNVGIASVAEYLYRETLTSARSYFQQLRKRTAEEAQPEEIVHTFGVHHPHREFREEDRMRIESLTAQLLAGWLAAPSALEREAIQGGVLDWWNSQQDELGWSINLLLKRGMQTIQGDPGKQIKAYFRETLGQITQAAELIQKVDAAFEASEAANHQPPRQAVEEFRAVLEDFAAASIESFQKELWKGLEEWPCPLAAADVVAETIRLHLEGCQNQLAQVIQQLDNESAHLMKNRPGDASAFLSRYANLRFCHEIHRALAECVEFLRGDVEQGFQIFPQLRERLSDRAAKPAAPQAGELADGGLTAEAERFDHELRSHGQRHLQQLSQEWDARETGWFRHIQSEAQKFIFASFAKTPTALEGRHNEARSFCTAALPQLHGVGGLSSAVLMVPNEEWVEYETHAKQVMGDCVTTLVDPRNPAFLCCETRNLKLADIRESISDRREDLKEVASRLHTRIDVNWES